MLFCTDFRFYFWIILYITKETVHGSNSEPDFSSDRWQGYLFHRFKPFIFNHLCIIVKTLKPLGKMCKGWPMDVCTLFRRTGRCTVRAYSNFGDLGGNIWQELMSVGLGYQSESLMAWFDDRPFKLPGMDLFQQERFELWIGLFKTRVTKRVFLVLSQQERVVVMLPTTLRILFYYTYHF